MVMGALQTTLIYFVLFQTCTTIIIITAQDVQWKSATATFTKDTNDSIIIGTSLPSFLQLTLTTYSQFSPFPQQFFFLFFFY